MVFFQGLHFKEEDLRRWKVLPNSTSFQWTWVLANSKRWWRTGKPAMLQFHGIASSMGSQRVGYDLVTEQQLSNGSHAWERWGCVRKEGTAFYSPLSWTRNPIFRPVVAHANDPWRENSIWPHSLSITPRVFVGYNTWIMRVSPGLPQEVIRVIPGSLLEGWLLEAGNCKLWNSLPPQPSQRSQDRVAQMCSGLSCVCVRAGHPPLPDTQTWDINAVASLPPAALFPLQQNQWQRLILSSMWPCQSVELNGHWYRGFFPLPGVISGQ